MAAVRPTRLGEEALLQTIEVLAGERFRDVGLPAVADDDPLCTEALATYTTEGRSWVVVDACDLPVGYVLVDLVDGSAHLEQLSVRPDWQGRGLGRALIDHVRAWAIGRRLRAITLTTFEGVPWNAPLYRHLGFVDLLEHEIGPELLRVRAMEAVHGLDPTKRVCMRASLEE